MTRLVLTIDQARDLQRLHGPDDTKRLWPGPWAFLLAIPTPPEPDSRSDLDRLNGGMKMLNLGCSEDQVAEQMSWRPNSAPLRTLARQKRRETKRS